MDEFELHYRWDPEKESQNRRKHGVRFLSAIEIFDDPAVLTIFDSDHSDSEDRWIAMGKEREGEILVVVFTIFVKPGREVYRIISAREATRSEFLQYYQGWMTK